MRKLLVMAAAAALVLAGAALAMRKPTVPEARAIRSAVAGFIQMPGSPAARDNTIASVAVSTLDRRYANVRLRSRSAGPSDLVLHRSMGTWWVVGFGSSLGCDTAPHVVLDDLHVGCTPPDGVAWIDTCGPLVSEPRSLVLACADGNYSLDRLTWRRWGSGTATATGRATANDCTPNCAAGHFHSYAVTVAAGRLRPCGRARSYARLTIVYAGARPAGIARRDVHVLAC